jgi:iron complex transport system ATP-binding protein
MPRLVHLDSVSLIRGKRTILDKVTFSVHSGEHWAVLGANGSGKTTVMNLITGYLWPTDGSVEVLGERYGTVDIRDKRKQIGLVSSALFERIPPRETFEDVVISGKHASLGIFNDLTEKDYNRAKAIVRQFECTHIAERPYRVLSFGERQRALIGRALMSEPSILILDEPFEGLDMHARETLMKIISDLTEKPTGPSILLVTHRIEEIMPGITHSMIMKQGKVLFAGSRDEAITSENLYKAMDVPVDVLHRNGRLYAVIG